METELLRDWPTLVWIERPAFCDVLEKDWVDDFAADISIELPTEVGDDTLSGCALDDCVLAMGALEGCALLDGELDGCIAEI